MLLCLLSLVISVSYCQDILKMKMTIQLYAFLFTIYFISGNSEFNIIIQKKNSNNYVSVNTNDYEKNDIIKGKKYKTCLKKKK